MNNPLETAIYSRLTGASALTSLLATATSVFNSVAPRGAGYPLVVFNFQAGGDENLEPRRLRNVVYIVKAVSNVSTNQAGGIDVEIDTALHGVPLSVSGWTNLWIARMGDIRYVETTPEGQHYYHSGGLYRIRLGK